MSFGLCNAPGTFQNKIKSKIKYIFIVTHHVYKCTDGESLRCKTQQYKQQDMKKLQYKNNYIHTLHNIHI